MVVRTLPPQGKEKSNTIVPHSFTASPTSSPPLSTQGQSRSRKACNEMGPHVGAHDIPGQRTGHRGGGHHCQSICCQWGRSRLNLLAVLVLATLAGCTTIVLQVIATRESLVEHKNEHTAQQGSPIEDNQTQVESIALDNIVSAEHEQGTTMSSSPWVGSKRWKQDVFSGSERIGSPVIPEYRVERHVIDRRFTGQKTGRPPKTEEELYKPAASTEPFGWGIDWAVGVSLEHGGEDVIDVPWCKDAENRSFVDQVIERRVPAAVDPFSRVALCVRTRDNGRYLPEWLSYHWVMGVDEFVILDDQSMDDTREVLEPFIRTGIVKFRQRHIRSSADRIKPLNECMSEYRDIHEAGQPSVPRWIVLIDSDEYLWYRDVRRTLFNVLETYSAACCLKVPRVKYGSSGFSETPRGLVIENFVMHADPSNQNLNGPPKVLVNMMPTDESRGTFNRLLDPHDTRDCKCDVAPVEELSVRHYSLSFKDFVLRTRRYRRSQQRTEQELKAVFRRRDINNFRNGDMFVWSCSVRRVLDRLASGRNIFNGKPSPTLSPHHPVSHGMRPLDPFGEQEGRRSKACTSVIKASPTVLGTAWNNMTFPLPWVQHLCNVRYVFVHFFEGTGGTDVARVLAAHPWAETHTGKSPTSFGGATLTASIPTAAEVSVMNEDALGEVCGCSSGDSPGCWRFCPKVQEQLLATRRVNRIRRQLLQDWLFRFGYQSFLGKPLILVEKDPDMMVRSKQGLFPFVSTSVISVRHPLCTPGPAKSDSDMDVAQELAEWRNVWGQVLMEQVPQTEGDVWVVRFEDLIAQEEEVSSALWAAIGLPPIAPYPGAAQTLMSSVEDLMIPTRSLMGQHGSGDEGKVAERSFGTFAGDFAHGVHLERGGEQPGEEGKASSLRRSLIFGDALSRASSAIQDRAFPDECKARVQGCEEGEQCSWELQRSGALMDFFGYGLSRELLNSQRFLWGKEELAWLGERLASASSLTPSAPVLYATTDGGTEESVILPQAYSV